MKIKYGSGRTQYGPGIDIVLDGNEMAQAIFDYIEKQGIKIKGSRTALVHGSLCPGARVYVDPSGSITYPSGEMTGRGPTNG